MDSLGGMNASFGDCDCLLLHDFVDGYTINVTHLINFTTNLLFSQRYNSESMATMRKKFLDIKGSTLLLKDMTLKNSLLALHYLVQEERKHPFHPLVIGFTTSLLGYKPFLVQLRQNSLSSSPRVFFVNTATIMALSPSISVAQDLQILRLTSPSDAWTGLPR